MSVLFRLNEARCQFRAPGSSTFFCCCLFQKAKDLSQHRKTFIGSQQTKVEKEIAKVQDRVIVETVSHASLTLCASGWLPVSRDEMKIL